MATETKEVSSVLNELIETCKDGENGYRHAADKVKDSSLKSMFMKYSGQRGTYAQELEKLVGGMGEEPTKSEHVTAKLHRGWISVKEAVTGDSDKQIVNEVEAGEDSAMKAYKEATSKSLPPEVAQVVQKQFAGVQEAHNIMRDMKHSQQ